MRCWERVSAAGLLRGAQQRQRSEARPVMKARGRNPMQIAIARLAAVLLVALPLSGPAMAAESEPEHATPHYPLMQPKHVGWSFAGPFGKYDTQQLQRGFQIY